MPFFDHYPYTNLHNVNLDWVLEAVKNWGAMVEQNNQNFIDLNAANEAFKEYVTSYITNLDVQEEINNKLDQMLASGALTQYFSPYIKTDVEDWLEENITPTTPPVDATLSIAGAAADAKAVGDRFATIDDIIDSGIADIVDAFDSLAYLKGTSINRCDYDAFTLDKYMQDGVIRDSTSYCLSDYCFIGDFTSRFVFRGHNTGADTTNTLTGVYWVTAFTKNKEYIGVIGSAAGQYTKPENCVYVRFTLAKTVYLTNDNIILEEMVGSVINTNNNLYSPPSYVVRPNRYLDWSDLKWACVGDSLTERNIRTTKGYYDYIAYSTGISIYNLGKSASGYHRGDNFYNRVANIPLDSDVVTFFGSFNDLGDGFPIGTADDTELTTIGGYVNATFDALNARIPIIPYGVIAPTPWGNLNPYDGSTNADRYVTLLHDICYKRGIPFLDLYHDSLLRVWDPDFRQYAFSKDAEGAMVHPDETGHNLIAPRIKAFLESLIMQYGIEVIT